MKIGNKNQNFMQRMKSEINQFPSEIIFMEEPVRPK